MSFYTNIFIRDLIRPYQGRLFLLAIFPIIWCFSEVLAPYLIKTMIDVCANTTVHSNEVKTVLFEGIIGYAGLMVLLEASARLCQYTWLKTIPWMVTDLQKQVFFLIQAHSLDFFYNQLSGELIAKYRDLSASFERLAQIFLYAFYPTVLSFIFSLILIGWLNSWFAVVFLVWFLTMLGITLYFFKQNILASQAQARFQNRLIGYVGNLLGNAIALLSFGAGLSNDQRFETFLQNYRSSAICLSSVILKGDLYRSMASWCLLLSMIVFLSVGWQRQFISLGDFSFMTAICFYMRRTVWNASIQLSDFSKELGTLREAFSLIFREDFVLETESEKLQLPILKGDLCLEKIYFSYGNKLIFKDLTLRVPLGEKIGIAGPSGSGKTSLLYLILGLYKPQQGRVLIDSQASSMISRSAYQDLFSYVPQNMSLLHASIMDNLRVGKVGASLKEIEEAAHVCLCDTFIRELEKGYETVIGEGGAKLSGGQRQRLSIARAYLKKAPVFILDEATTGLEADLETKLVNNLCRALKDHTLIVISHREEILSKMDWVLRIGQYGFLES